MKKGYSREWINQRLQAIQVRKELTDEWQDRGGDIAGNARKALEVEIGKSVITSDNAIQLNKAVLDMLDTSSKLIDSKETDK